MDSDDDDGDGATMPISTVGQWKKEDPGLIGTKVPPFIRPVLSAGDQDKLENCKTAYDFYKLFQPDEFVDEVVYQSKLYGEQKNLGKSMELVTSNTYRYIFIFCFVLGLVIHLCFKISLICPCNKIIPLMLIKVFNL